MQIAFAMVVSRLLSPEDFGVVTVSSVLLRIAGFVSQLGLGAATVHVTELTKRGLQSALTAAVALGITGMCLGVLLATPIAHFLGSAEARPVVVGQSMILPVLSVSAVLGGVMQRHFMNREVAMLEVISYGLGFLGVGIALAALGAGPLSLVGAFAASSVLTLMLQFHYVRPPLSAAFDRHEGRLLLSFGARVSAVSLLEAFSTNADVLAVGHYAGATPAGQYNRANQLAGTPMQQGIAATGRVMLAYQSRIRDDRRRLGRVTLTLVHLFAAGLAPFVVFLTIWRTPLIRLAFGDGWGSAAAILPFVGVGSASLLLACPITTGLEAIGLLRFRALMQVIQLSVLGIGIGLAVTHDGGIAWYAGAWMASELTRVVGYSAIGIARLSVPARDYLRGFADAGLTSLAVAIGSTPTLALFGGPTIGAMALGAASCAVLLALLVRTGLLHRSTSFTIRAADAAGWRGVGLVAERLKLRELIQ